VRGGGGGGGGVDVGWMWPMRFGLFEEEERILIRVLYMSGEQCSR